MVTSTTDFALVVLFGAGLILLGLLIIQLVAKVWTGFPGEKEIKLELKAEAQKAIYAGLSIVQAQFGALDASLKNPAILQHAYAAYHTLPQVVSIGGRVIPIGEIKIVLTEESWQALCREVLGATEHFVKVNQDYLAEKQKEYEPPPTPSLTITTSTVPGVTPITQPPITQTQAN